MGDDDLLAAARAAAADAYAPYSGFAVGAAVRTRSGRIHPGANMENASYGLSLCAEAAALARAVAEMSKLGVAMGGDRDTFAGLAGMGDLIVTCTSQRSRNRHVGEQLGSGKSIEEIISAMNQVAEGVKAASVIMEFAEKFGISMPIAREVDGVVNHGSTVEQAYRGLVAEKPGHEVHGSGF